MSIVDRTNAWLLKRMRDRRPVLAVDGDTLVVSEGGTARRLSLADATSIHAWQRDVFAGAVMTLRLGFAGGIAFEIGEGDPAWAALVAALDTGGRVRPSRQWQLELLAQGVDGPPLALH